MFEGIGYALKEKASDFITYISDLFRAHYNVVGNAAPPFNVSEFNIFAQVILFPFVLLPAWCCSLLIAQLKSTKGTIVTMTRFALGQSLSDKLIGKGFDTITVESPDGTQTEEGDTRSDKVKFGVGFLGAFIVGPIIGLIPVIAIGFVRTIWHSALTFRHTVRTMVNAALINEKRYTNDDGTAIEDTRRDRIYYGLGFLGLGFGVVVGSVAALVAASVESGKRLLSNMLSAVLNPEDKHWVAIAKVDDRHRAVKYLLGLPGGIVAFFPAAIGMFLLGAARIVTNTVKTSVATFVTLANLVLSKKDFYPHLALQTDKTRSVGLVLLGGVGFLFGGAAVLVAGPVYLLKHIAVQTKKSWVALSGSIMNVALGDQEFSGLAGDENRRGINKFLGGLGYIAALPVSIIGLCVLAVRKRWDVLVGIPAIILSPFTAIGKVLYTAVKGHRFDSTNQDNTIDAFKNLYSSLNPLGEFNPGEVITSHGTGKKGALSYVRKIFSFSWWTTTERTINKLLKKYKESESKDKFFEGTEFSSAISKVQAKLAKFTPEDKIQDKKREVQQVANFVRDYVEGKKNQVSPDIYARKSLRSTFWGKPPEVLPVAAPVEENDGTHSPRKDT